MFITIVLSIALVCFIIALALGAFAELTRDSNTRRIANVFTAVFSIICGAALLTSGGYALVTSESGSKSFSQQCSEQGKVYYDKTCYTNEQFKIMKDHQ